jgi:hypothetical protein
MPNIWQTYEAAVAANKLHGWMLLRRWYRNDNDGVHSRLLANGYELRDLMEHPPRDRGRPKGSGAAFSGKQDFFAKTSSVIRFLEAEQIEPTRLNVACELMKRGVFQTGNISTAETNLKRTCTRYGLTFRELVARVRRS